MSGRRVRDVPADYVLGTYGAAYAKRGTRRCNPGLTVATVISCLILAPLLGAVIYQRQSDLSAMDQIKREIAHHLHQIKELKDFTQVGLGRISMYGDLDTERQVIFLEQARQKMQQNIQLISQRMLREK